MKTHRFLLLACTGLGAFGQPCHGVTATLSGGDAGQGITLDAANFVKALNLGTGTAQTIQTKTFSGTPNAGFAVTAPAGSPGNFTGTFAFGASETSADDTAMATVARTLCFSTNGFDVTVNSLTPGGSYKVELIQSVTTSFASREQAILLGGVWQENVLLPMGNHAKVTSLIATANASGQIVVGLRPSGAYGGSGPQDGAVLNGIAVTAVPDPDSDSDLLPDLWEQGYFPGDLTKLQAPPADFDGDGATDKQEFDASTNPTDPDSDDDNLTDGEELNRMVNGVPAPTNPNSRDTDGDGLLDNEETGTGLFVNAANTGSNPLVADSDGDTFHDHIEVLLGSDPNSSASVPTGPAPGPLVSLSASALSEGSLSSWTNEGRLGRSFQSTATPPQVTTLQGVKGVTLDGIANALTGPAAPSILTGNSSRTIEAWIYNPSTAAAETIVSWGRRDGPNGTLSAFIHGTNAQFGAFGGWGAGADAGWGSVPPKAGRWTHVACTYDGATGSFKLYADGVPANQKTSGLSTWATDAAGNPLPIRIGGQNGTTGILVGESASLTIARLAVHDRALTAAELGMGDSDSDGLPNDYEIFFGLNPDNAADAGLDPDNDGVTSLIEYRLGTNPSWQNPDTDNDGLFDEWELAHFRDPFAEPAETDAEVLAKQSGSGDADGDTFSNRMEFLGGSDPNSDISVPTDQDGDGMADAWETEHFGSIAANPFDDPDNDASSNLDEFYGDTLAAGDWATDASDPNDPYSQPDTDGNGIGDGWETRYFFGAGSAIPGDDPDTDGATNLEEYGALSDPEDFDTDDDGLSDGAEIHRPGGATNPLKADSDDDGLNDPVETDTGTYVNRSNTGTSPIDADSDNDTHPDGLEVARGSNPLNASSLPGAYGLIAHWNLNDSAAAQPDATLNGTVENVTGNTPTLAWEPAGGIGGALRVTANTDRIVTGSPDLRYGFTVMGWIKPDAAQVPWVRFLTSRFQDGFYLGRDAGSNRWLFVINNNFNLGGGTITADTWQHVCGTYDGVTARLFVNGVLIGSAPMAPPSRPVQPVHFGTEGSVDRTFTGAMDEIRIYSGAMPDSDLLALYQTEAAAIHGSSAYDTWAISFGLNPQTNGAPAQDPDGDGTTNEVEFALGLSPVSGTSRFAVTQTGTPAGGITLTWPSKPGISFQVRSGADLVTFPTLEATVTGAAEPAATTSWTSGPLPAGGRKFYRIEFTP